MCPLHTNSSTERGKFAEDKCDDIALCLAAVLDLPETLLRRSDLGTVERLRGAGRVVCASGNLVFLAVLAVREEDASGSPYERASGDSAEEAELRGQGQGLETEAGEPSNLKELEG